MGEHRAELTAAIAESLREASIQLSRLNHTIGGHVDLNGVDLECLDLITRHGPISPGALADRAGLHPATMTGVLDRLERSGWVSRERDRDDRRRVRVRALGDPLGDPEAELARLYSGMAGSLARILAGYRDDQLELLLDFLSRTSEAGRAAVAALAVRAADPMT